MPKTNPQKEPLLLTPGPTILSLKVRKSLSLPMEHHRSPRFDKSLKNVLLTLKTLFQTSEPVLILSSSGTGAMEAAVSNLISPGEEVITVVAGKFGERWMEIAGSFGAKVHSIKVSWGKTPSLKKIEETLKKHPKAKAFFISAVETSTATKMPILEISKVLKKYPDILFIVDGITGLGAMPLPQEKLGIDVLMAASQKTFQIPTGLSFISLSKKAWEAVDTCKTKKYYFDLKKEKKAQEKGQTRFSSSVSLIFALEESLKSFGKDFTSSIKRCQKFQKASLAFLKEMKLPLCSSSPAPSVTAFFIKDAGVIKKELEKKGVIIAGGQGDWKGEVLRIGHLGLLKEEDFLKALKLLAHLIQIAKILKKDPEKSLKKALDRAKKALKS